MNTLVRENKKINHIMDKEIRPYLSLTLFNDMDAYQNLLNGMEQLKDLAIHYQKKKIFCFLTWKSTESQHPRR